MRKKLFLLAIIVFSSLLGFSQAPEPCNPDDPTCFEETPIDGGTGFLIAAGVAYGLKKLNEKRRKEAQ